jgi:hypothetical protein
MIRIARIRVERGVDAATLLVPTVTVSLLIKRLPDEQTLVPVAAESAFLEHWAPGAAALDLRWVPLFPAGLWILEEDLPEIVRELRNLRQWAENTAPATLSVIAPRIDVLIRELEQLKVRPALEVFIG